MLRLSASLLSLLLITSCCHCNRYKTKYSNITNVLYANMNDNLNYIFRDKKTFDSLLKKLSTKYKVDFGSSKNIEELDKKMQSTLLRNRGHERVDLDCSIDILNSFGPDGVFNKLYSIDNYDFSNKKIIIPGTFYKEMDHVAKNVAQYDKNISKKRVIVLTGDRPMIPEDFIGSNVDDFVSNLTKRTPKYKIYNKELKVFVEKYLNDKASEPPVKRATLMADIVSLIDKKASKKAYDSIAVMRSLIKDGKSKSKEFLLAAREVREFIYVDAIKYIPTETHLAYSAMKNNNINNFVIIEAKNNYKIQDRANTMDTYEVMIDYFEKNKLSYDDHVIVARSPFVYRQWLQINLFLKKKLGSDFKIDYAATEPFDINDAILADELARLIHVASGYR